MEILGWGEQGNWGGERGNFGLVIWVVGGEKGSRGEGAPPAGFLLDPPTPVGLFLADRAVECFKHSSCQLLNGTFL